MGLPQAQSPLSASEYLAREREQPIKSEFFRGEVFAIGGASRRHAAVTLDVAASLMDRLDGTPCRVYAADMKLRILDGDAYVYPDVLVTCDAGDRQADQFMALPTLIVEVLSPSTAAFDRGDKCATYRRIPSLREFVLIDPDKRNIELSPQQRRRLGTSRHRTRRAVEAREPGDGGRLGSRLQESRLTIV
jgi:Uma2 family endonuclease